jgi:nucleolar GTP-binding protein
MLKYGKDEGLEKKIINNRVKEIMEANGGDGVFYIPDRAHFVLENPDWKDDIWPEIMDGKNVFDFIDPDIKEKLKKLEEEEERYENQMNIDDEVEEDSDIDDELLEEHDKVMENQKKINILHKSVKTSQLPKKVRELTLTEKFMTDLRTDKAEGVEKLKLLSNKLRKDEKDKTKRTLIKNAKLRDEDITDSDEEDNMMDIDEEDNKFKGKKLSKEEKLKKQKEEQLRQEIAQRMKDKIQKKFNRKGIINEADKRIGTKMPVHLNTGKRGIGKTDRR